MRARVVIRQVKPSHEIPTSHTRELIEVPAAPLLHQLPADVPKKAGKDSPSSWILATQKAELGESPRFLD